MNITNYEPTTDGLTYDSFNNFIFSNDLRVIGKLLFRYHFYNLTRHLPGDIVEVGVFKGTGIASWLKILKVFDSHQTNKRVIGFDFFSETDTANFTKNEEAGSALNSVIERVNPDTLSFEAVSMALTRAGFDKSDFILVKGNVETTAHEFVSKNPGFRISLLYLDADLGSPTYHALLSLWDRIVPGGYIIFDEYEYHAFNECAGVEQFLCERKIEYTIETTHCIGPTAFMIKKNF
jgi:hypothetical protein